MFWHMADDPSQVQKLRDEFQRLDQMGEVDYLQSYPHLDGMVNECLRLHPALPSGGLRTTPPEGITVGSTYIPGNVTICAPRYSLGRRKIASVPSLQRLLTVQQWSLAT